MDANNPPIDLATSIAALRAGNSALARRSLTHTLIHNPQHALAWLYLSLLMPTAEQAHQCLEQSLTLHINGRPRIGEWLILQGVITRAQLEHSLTEQAVLHRHGHHIRLGELLVRSGFLQRDALERALLTCTDPHATLVG